MEGFLAGLLELGGLSEAASVQGRMSPSLYIPSPFLTSVLLLWRGQEPRCPCVGQECAPCSPIWLSADLYSTLLPLQTGFLKPLITKLSFSLKQLYLAEGTVVTQLEGTHPTRKVTRP